MERKVMRSCACLLVGALVVGVTPAFGQDDCATAVGAACGSAVTMDVCADGNPTGPLPACATGGGVQDVWATFVATNTAARIRTDIGSVGTDSDYVVYSVDQGDICNSASWTVVGCSEDEAPPWLGDITVTDLTPGDTYLIQLGSWGDVGGCQFDIDIECFDPPPFPALPNWGLVGLAVLLLGGGAVIFGRLRVAA